VVVVVAGPAAEHRGSGGGGGGGLVVVNCGGGLVVVHLIKNYREVFVLSSSRTRLTYFIIQSLQQPSEV